MNRRKAILATAAAALLGPAMAKGVPKTMGWSCAWEQGPTLLYAKTVHWEGSRLWLLRDNENSISHLLGKWHRNEGGRLVAYPEWQIVREDNLAIDKNGKKWYIEHWHETEIIGIPQKSLKVHMVLTPWPEAQDEV